MSCAFSTGLKGRNGTPARTDAQFSGRQGWRAVRVLGLLLCISALPQLAEARKPFGKVLNEQALQNIHTYCFDTTGLSDRDAYLVRGFARREDKPKHLLAKLSWKLMPSCREGSPDALVKVNFELVKVYGVLFGDVTPNPMTRGDSTHYQPEAVLQVVEKDSGRPIYRAQAAPLANTSSNSSMPAPDNPTALRLQALRNVVATFVHDMRFVTSHGK